MSIFEEGAISDGANANVSVSESVQPSTESATPSADTYEVGWYDPISDGDNLKYILPVGDYKFVITDFEKGRHPGSAKLPACNKAMLTLLVDGPKGQVSVKTDLFLSKSTEWKNAAFFRCIGLKKRGTEFRMCWDKVKGCEGWATFKPRTYADSTGKLHEINNVDKFIDPEDVKSSAVEFDGGPNRKY